MVTGDSGMKYFWVGIYVRGLPWWRRLLSRHFDKFKVTEKEYLDWLWARMEKGL